MIGKKEELIKYLVDAPDKMYQVKEYHPKRSLTANAYYHKLKSLLADALKTSVDELHEEMLRRYSYPLLREDGTPIPIEVSNSVPLNALPGHWKYYKPSVDHPNASYYYAIKGSSEMDAREMSRLLDGLISDIEDFNREVGYRQIEVIPPHELARLKGYAPKDKGSSDKQAS